jgi:peptidyl-prolyl cis-trans isomerase D
MAVLSKIRQRSILLIGVIGFCLLAFIIGDIVNSGGFGVTKNVGSVNGTDIPVKEFLEKVNNTQQQQQGASATQAANYVWSTEVNRILLEERFEKAGIRVGREHVLDVYAQMLGQNPQFMNALGKFDKNKFNEFLANLKTTNPQQYNAIEKERPSIESSAKSQLYGTMLKAGYFTTNLEGKARFAQENNKVTFDYVLVPYTTINDDQVKVSDEELTAYMKKNEKKYKAEASRDIEFVFLDNKPSQADEAEVKKNIEGLLVGKVAYNDETKTTDSIAGFAAAKNNEEFVNLNSEIKFDSTYVTKSQLPVEHAQQIYNLAPGQVYGPYVDNGYYKITKMVAKKGGASVKASHILVGYKGGSLPDPKITITKEEAKAKADGLLAQVRSNPESFTQLVALNSNDQGSVANGGVYDNVVPNQMVKPFNDYIFNNPVGSTGVVETDFGYHVIKVLDKYEGVQVATVAQKIQPTEATTDANFVKATKLEMDARDSGKSFTDLAKAAKLTVTPANALGANDENIPGVGSQRPIVRWAYDKGTKVGDVKKFDVAQGSVVARLKAINDKGLLPLEEAKVSVLPIIRNEKKAELIKKKMAGTTLDAVAKASGSSIATATGVAFASPMVPSVGPELKVVGKAFGLAAGKTSGLIEGTAGVFMIRATNVEKVPAPQNFTAITSRLNAEGRGNVQGRITNALKDAADIEDNRYEFN